MNRSSCALEGAAILHESSPSERVAHREPAVPSVAALARLPEYYREVMILYDLEGVSFPKSTHRMRRSMGSI